MAYLVTGGMGFIGSHVIRDLLQAGKEVVSLDVSGITPLFHDVVGENNLGIPGLLDSGSRSGRSSATPLATIASPSPANPVKYRRFEGLCSSIAPAPRDFSADRSLSSRPSRWPVSPKSDSQQYTIPAAGFTTAQPLASS